jgi:hypothetical protein
VVNSGIGPAVIQSVDASFNGKPVQEWHQLAESALGHPLHSYSSSSISDRVIRAGEQVQVLDVPVSELTSATPGALAPASIVICYSSVFDEQWVLESPSLMGRSSWRTVKGCSSTVSVGAHL